MDCRRAITPLPDPLCNRCGYPLSAEGLACVYCQHHPLPATLDGLRSAAYFEGPLQHALHRLKYRRDIILADALAVWLAEACQRYQLAPEVVVAVPLSAQRLRERGYNQAGLLAGALADLVGARYAPQALARVRHTPSQVGLTQAQRRENVQGAFAARGRAVAGRSVVLVDDVCTTGATLMAGAAVLRAAGAAQVWGLTLGRAR